MRFLPQSHLLINQIETHPLELQLDQKKPNRLFSSVKSQPVDASAMLKVTQYTIQLR